MAAPTSATTTEYPAARGWRAWVPWLRQPPKQHAQESEPTTTVTFQQMLAAHSAALKAQSPEQEVELRRVIRLWEAQHGPITHAFFGQADWVAVVLTGTNELWVESSAAVGASTGIDDVLQRCEVLRADASMLRNPDTYRLFLNRIYAVIAYALMVHDHIQAERSLRKSGPALAETRKMTQRVMMAAYNRAAANLERVLQQQVQLWYFLGLSGTAILVLAITVGMGSWGMWRGDSFLQGAFAVGDEGPMLLSAVAGGIGAAVSVLTRMTKGALTLDPFAQRWQALVLGGGRIVLGAVFGVVVYFLIAADILPVELPPNVAPVDPGDAIASFESGFGPAFYFVACLAFLAGFSERFAQDALTTSEAYLLPAAPVVDRPPASVIDRPPNMVVVGGDTVEPDGAFQAVPGADDTASPRRRPRRNASTRPPEA